VANGTIYQCHLKSSQNIFQLFSQALLNNKTAKIFLLKQGLTYSCPQIFNQNFLE
jgi:hypothetical protein